MNRMKKIDWKKASCILYCVLLFVFVAVQFTGNFEHIGMRIAQAMEYRQQGVWRVNLVPFATISVQLSRITQQWAQINLLGNVAVFMALSFLLPFAYPKMRGFLRCFSTGILVSVGIEVFQFVTMLGSLDVDDVLLAAIGTIMGYCIWSGYQQVYPTLSKKLKDALGLAAQN